MGRKSNEQLAAEAAAREAEIDRKVDERVSRFKDEILGQISAIRAAEGQPQPVNAATVGGDQAFADALALSIANLGNQGKNKQTYVAPEVMRQREDARDRMQQLLVRAHTAGVVPTYTVLTKMYLDEVLVEPQYQDPSSKSMEDTVIQWGRPPNEGMSPRDETAKEIYAAFLESIGSVPKARPEKAPYVLSGKLIVKGRSLAQRKEGDTGFQDPRVPLDAKKKAVPVFGTVAPPVQVGFGS